MILQQGNGTKFTKQMGIFVINNFQKMSRSEMAKVLKIKRYAIDTFCQLNKLNIFPTKLENNKNEIIQNIKSGKSQSEVAKIFNTSSSAVGFLLKKYKIVKPLINKHEKLDNFIKNNQHLNCNQISLIFNTSTETVRNRFIKLNIKRQTPAQALTKWNNQSIQQEALKYTTKQDFFKNSNGAYQKAWKLNILDKVCNHMTISGDLYNRFVYIYQFSDNSIYVGITLNKKQRHLQHLTKGIAKNRTILKYKVSKLLSAKDALALEQKMVDLFKINGYTVLNKNKCFSLWFVKEIWTKHKIIEAAKLCKTRKEFNIKYSTASKKARKNGYYEKIVKHMPKDAKTRKIKNVNTNKIFVSIQAAANYYNCCNSRIANAVLNNKKTFNSHWEYVK